MTIHNVPVVLRRRWTASSRCPASARSRYDLAFGGNFYAIVRSTQIGLPFDRARAAGDPRRRDWRSWPRSTLQDEPVHPEDPTIRGCHHVQLRSRPAPTPGTRGTRWRSTPAGSTARRAAPAPRARMAQLHARGELAARRRLRQRVVHRHAASSAGSSRQTTVGGFARRRAHDHRTGVGHRAPPSTCSTPPIRSRPASCCERSVPSCLVTALTDRGARAMTAPRTPRRDHRRAARRAPEPARAGRARAAGRARLGRDAARDGLLRAVAGRPLRRLGDAGPRGDARPDQGGPGRVGAEQGLPRHRGDRPPPRRHHRAAQPDRGADRHPPGRRDRARADRGAAPARRGDRPRGEAATT